MDILYPRCAGLDVHKKFVVACRITRDANGKSVLELRTFSTMTADLLALLDWLEGAGVTHVAMESTGEFWKPVYNILEGHFELLVVNAKHVKNVPGRKTDVKDAQWIAELLQVGLLRASFVPPAGQRAMRDLTRHRSTFIRERAALCNRVQKVLETANIKLASVATDVLGVSGRAMLDALVGGQGDPKGMAELAKGRLRDKRGALEQALTGRVGDVHRFVLGELLCQIDSLDESIARFDAEIERVMAPFAEAVELLDTITGVGQTSAQVIVSEVGVDMSRFASARHLAAWAGVAPGNHESAGKRLSGRTRKGSPALRTALVEAAQAAARTKDTYLAAQYRRLAPRRGQKRAAVAVAHTILVIIYHLLRDGTTYRELGATYFDERDRQAVEHRLIRRLEALGNEVTIHRRDPAA